MTNQPEITNRSQSQASRAEMRHPLRHRTVHNNGVVPHQAAAALRLLAGLAAAVPGAPPGDATGRAAA
jgi:hypothetical protein